MTDPMSRVTSYTYGSGTTGNPLLVNDLLTITKPNAQPGGPDAGDSTVNVFNASGQVISQTDPAGFVTTFNYSNLDASTGNGTVTATEPDGATTVYEYESGALGAQSQWSGAIGSTLVSDPSYGPNLTTGTLLDMWSTNGDVSSSGAPEETSYTYDQHGNETSETNPLGETTTTWSTSLDEPSCDGAALATTNCSSSLQGPAPVTPGGTITPPSSAPPEGVTYTLYDTYGNALYTTTGVYEPGAQTASYLRTNYTLYRETRSRSTAPRSPAPPRRHLPRLPAPRSTPTESSPSSPTTRQEISSPRPPLTGTAPSWPRPPTPTTETESRPPRWHPTATFPERTSTTSRR